jgi:tetratricopeptide (TPR) repeat protein
MTETVNDPIDPIEFRFWTAPDGMALTTGENTEIKVPQIPLPIKTADMPDSSAPTEKAIGDGIYEYLSRFPFCQHAEEYAKILHQAYPFLISDIGSQLILLDVKQVNPDGLKKKIALLKILNYLEPDNFGLLYKIGHAYFDLGLHYSELTQVKFQLKEARVWLEKARRVNANEINNLNLLGQVCYLNGAYHQARLYWQIAVNQLEDDKTKAELTAKLARIEASNLPDKPLADSLEKIAVALEHVSLEEFIEAREILEHLELVGDLTRELPNAEFYYLLGLCREKCEDVSGAFEAYSTAVKLDKNHQPAQDALKRIHYQS